jgi:hypothetical protein
MSKAETPWMTAADWSPESGGPGVHRRNVPSIECHASATHAVQRAAHGRDFDLGGQPLVYRRAEASNAGVLASGFDKANEIWPFMHSVLPMVRCK